MFNKERKTTSKGLAVGDQIGVINFIKIAPLIGWTIDFKAKSLGWVGGKVVDIERSGDTWTSWDIPKINGNLTRFEGEG